MVHSHQPVGNFSSVFGKAFSEAYLPFLEKIADHPRVKLTLHFSGPLWEYMEAKKPEAWSLIKLMVERQQVELLGGGFYEPILPIITEADRQGQLQLMTDYLTEKFGQRPQGAWLAERIWEPQLAKTLARAGYKYTLLDEEHFISAGITNPRVPFLTEDEGYALTIFPIDKKLRYLIPFHPLEAVKAYFDEIRESGTLAILGDDGEKFGLWPGTKTWVYEEGWLDNFLSFLSQEDITTMTLADYLQTNPRMRLVYLPPASYEEMTEWVLEPEQFWKLRELKHELPGQFRRLVRGGFWREFLLKYPESNHLHKRMLALSRKLRSQPDQNPDALRELYRGQCNDAYWHGVFGGLYLPHLRQAVYYHLLEAEKKAGLKTGWERCDYDYDGKEELFYRQELFGLIFKPSSGGSLVELDFRPLSRNLSAVLSRRPEAYHLEKEASSGGKSIHELSKKIPEEAKKFIRYDHYPKLSLLDHFLPPGLTEKSWQLGEHEESGDFINQEYVFELKENNLHLERRAAVRKETNDLKIRIKKEVTPKEKSLFINYRLKNLSALELRSVFGVEWNLNLLPTEWRFDSDRLIFLAGRLTLKFSLPPRLWVCPLQTFSQSEEGYDIIHQGFTFLPNWPLSLAGGQEFSVSMQLRFQNEP